MFDRIPLTQLRTWDLELSDRCMPIKKVGGYEGIRG
jgi:hypothetical protein